MHGLTIKNQFYHSFMKDLVPSYIKRISATPAEALPRGMGEEQDKSRGTPLASKAQVALLWDADSSNKQHTRARPGQGHLRFPLPGRSPVSDVDQTKRVHHHYHRLRSYSGIVRGDKCHHRKVCRQEPVDLCPCTPLSHHLCN